MGSLAATGNIPKWMLSVPAKSKSQPKRRLAMGESGKKDKGSKEQKKKAKLNPKEKRKLKKEKKKNKFMPG